MLAARLDSHLDSGEECGNGQGKNEVGKEYRSGLVCTFPYRLISLPAVSVVPVPLTLVGENLLSYFFVNTLLLQLHVSLSGLAQIEK